MSTDRKNINFFSVIPEPSFLVNANNENEVYSLFNKAFPCVGLYNFTYQNEVYYFDIKSFSDSKNSFKSCFWAELYISIIISSSFILSSTFFTISIFIKSYC